MEQKIKKIKWKNIEHIEKKLILGKSDYCERA